MSPEKKPSEIESETNAQLKESLRTLKEEAAQLGDRAAETIRELKEKVSIYGEGAGEVLDSLAVYTKEHPQKAALIAGGVGIGMGIILGLLMRNRH